MSQKTNLNASPYFDDFDAEKAYYKVLFNPGKPVQARELNNLQSQLQNQIEKFGNNIFRDGSMVIPGGLVYDLDFYGVKINSVQSGINVNIYIKNFIGKTIVGKNSKITATLDYVALPTDSDEVELITLYVKYKDSAEDGKISQFPNSESFYCEEDVLYGNTIIPAGTVFASSIPSNSTTVGSAAHIEKGVYFVRGFFVDVLRQTIILDYYNNKPSYRIGLSINESIVNFKDDNTLYDNASGFTNFAAPGADRFSITLKLDKRDLDDKTDSNFIDLLKIDSGDIIKSNVTTQYSLIKDYLAKRTYEESGNYSVIPFNISVKESLNDRLGNGGVYLPNRQTIEGNTPSDDLASLVISPGIAYVEGYDIDKTDISTVLDLEKPRTTAVDANSQVLFRMGNYIRVNNVYGYPILKGNIEIYNERKQSDTIPAGVRIGDARIYSFNLTDSVYEGEKTSWDLRLFDIQTYTELTLNKVVGATDIKESYHIKGNNSSASGYSVYNGNSTDKIYVRQTSGFFVEGEKIIINGKESITRTITNVRQFTIDDIKSLYYTNGSYIFSADALLDKKAIPNISSGSEFFLSQDGTLRSPQNFFTGISTGAILSYSGTGNDIHYNKVDAISSDGSTVTLTSIPDVVGICSGFIGVSADDTRVSVSLRVPTIISNNDGTLFVELPKSYVSSVNLSGSSISFISQSTSPTTVTGNSLSLNSSSFDLPVGLTTASFQGFDQERYSLHWNDGTIESLDSDQFDLVDSGNGIQFSNIENKTTGSVFGTLIKRGIKSKIKNYKKSTVVNYSYTNTGVGSSEYNLTESDVYGIRIQDKEICLTYPDVSEVIAVYESIDSGEPTLDKLVIDNANGAENNIIKGENIVGKTSGAVARVIGVVGSSPSIEIEIVYLNNDKFTPGEFLEFTESLIVGKKISSIILGKYKNLTNKYSLDSGQKGQYYDYSKIIRSSNILPPNKKLKVIFDHYTVRSEDSGDVFTALSYSKNQYYDLIPRIKPTGVFATDTLDFRPRVSEISDISLLTKSPFDFGYRNFGNTPNLLLSPDEVCILSVEYYLPRIDKLYLDKNGNFVVEKGTPSESPTAPTVITNSMLLCTLSYPPFLDDVSEVLISLESNRRYTMRDIGSLDTRIANLERVTTLSLLEVDTKTLEIRDGDGINMFKSGFFADDFKSDAFIDSILSAVSLDRNIGQITPQKTEYTLQNLPIISDSGDTDEFTGRSIFKSSDGNVRISGSEDDPESLTLDYVVVPWIEQPFSTGVDNVNPFHVTEYIGDISLNPSEDNWVRTIQLESKVFSNTSYRLLEPITNVVNNSRTADPVLLRGKEFDRRARKIGAKIKGKINKKNGRAVRGSTFRLPARTEVSASSQLTTVGSPETTAIEFSSIVNSYGEDYIRSRNVEFVARNLKPFTNFYNFIDSTQSPDFISKIIKIQIISGVFQTGEDVIGYSVVSGGINAPVTGDELIRFKLASPNHKFGPIDSPQKTYTKCPYDRDITLPSNYSSSLSYLNIDTTSLASEAKGSYYGYLGKAMKFVGKNSGAQALLVSNELRSDSAGDLIGAFFIRDVIKNPNETLKFTTGTKTYKVSSSETNKNPIPGSTDISSAETSYTATGTVNERQDTSISNTTISQQTITTITNTRVKRVAQKLDPLAQSFEVGRTTQQAPRGTDIDPTADSAGAFLVAVDLYFAKKATDNSSLIVEVRELSLGTVTLNVLGKPKTLRPDEINVSDDASVSTTVVFDYPIYLAPNEEYAIVLISPQSLEYEVFTAEYAKSTYEGGTYNTQFAIGSLFKSQNGSIWTADQTKDMKFTLYKAQFVDSGLISFVNPSISALPGDDIARPDVLIENPIEVYPRKILVGINTVTSSTINSNANLSIGAKLTESGSKEDINYGFIEGYGGPVSTVNIINGGRNYSDGVVETYNITGSGSGLTLNISTTDGAITNIVSIGNTGIGYNDGDVVGIVTSSTLENSGFGAIISIDAADYINAVVMTNTQGQNFSVGQVLEYYDNLTPTSTGLTIVSSNPYGGFFEGNIAVIDHLDHGMYLGNNLVNIIGLVGDVQSTITSTIDSSLESLTQIQVEDALPFAKFEGVDVSASNPGYVIIVDEIMKYTGVDINAKILTGITRQIDGTLKTSYYSGQTITKYEISNISIRRFSGNLNANNIPGESDKYYIEIDRTSANSNTDRASDNSISNAPLLSFKQNEYIGGNSIKSTKNIQFSEILPSYDIYGSRTDVSVSAKVRTVSGRSVDGVETPFLDLGYQDIQLNRVNTFNTLRMVASRPNETTYLSELPDSKSFTTTLSLSTKNPNVSPQLFLNNCVTKFTLNRLNAPISNYPEDFRANEEVDLVNNMVYYSNPVELQQKSTSIKVILSAYKPASADIRLLYSLIMPDSYEVEQSYTLFPGYNNLTIDSNQDGFLDVVNLSLNDGLPDFKVSDSLEGEFKEYEFTAPNLPQFTGFTIKAILTSTNQADPPIIKNIRAIALA